MPRSFSPLLVLVLALAALLTACPAITPTTPTPSLSPSGFSAEITKVGCNVSPTGDGVNRYEVTATGNARAPVGGAISFALADPDQSFVLDSVSADSWTGARERGYPEQTQRRAQADRNESTPWTASWHAHKEKASLTFHLIVSSVEPGRTALSGELVTSIDLTCKADEPRAPSVTVDSVDCVVVQTDGDRRAYEIRGLGSAYGPERATATVVVGSDADPAGAFAITRLNAQWTVLGTPVPLGFRHDAEQPVSTNWSVVARSGLLPPSATRNVAVAIGLEVDPGAEGTDKLGARRTAPCQPIELKAAETPTPTPVLQSTIDPARDLTGTWRGGMNLVRADDQDCEWSGPLVLNIQQTGSAIGGNGQVTFAKGVPLRDGVNCPAQTNSIQLNLAGTVSSSRIQINAGQGTDFNGSFTTDLMSGTLTWTGGYQGCFQASRAGSGGLPNCANSYLKPTPTPTRIPGPTPTPTPTRTPTPTPTRTPEPAAAASVTIQTATCAVKSSDAYFAVWEINATGTVSGPVGSRLVVFPVGDTVGSTASWMLVSSPGSNPTYIRQTGQPESTAWTARFQYSGSKRSWDDAVRVSLDRTGLSTTLRQNKQVFCTP